MELEEIRAGIDEIDGQLLALFCRRMDLVRDVAEYKIENNMPVFHPEREEQILERVSEKAGPDYADYAADFFRSLMQVSRSMQQALIRQSEQGSRNEQGGQNEQGSRNEQGGQNEQGSR